MMKSYNIVQPYQLKHSLQTPVTKFGVIPINQVFVFTSGGGGDGDASYVNTPPKTHAEIATSSTNQVLD